MAERIARVHHQHLLVVTPRAAHLPTNLLRHQATATELGQFQSVVLLQGPWACRTQRQNTMAYLGLAVIPLTAITGSLDLHTF